MTRVASRWFASWIIAWLLVLGLAPRAETQAGAAENPAPEAEAAVRAAPPADEPSRHRVLLLPARSEGGVRRRYLDRLEEAISAATEQPAGPAGPQVLRLPREARKRCGDDVMCMTIEGKRMGATRALETSLASVGEDFEMTTRLRDLRTGEVLMTKPSTLSHYRLRSQGGAILDDMLAQAARPRADLVPKEEDGNEEKQTNEEKQADEEPRPEPAADVADKADGDRDPKHSPSQARNQQPSANVEPTAPLDGSSGSADEHVPGTGAGDEWRDETNDKGGSDLGGAAGSEQNLGPANRGWAENFQKRRESFAKRANHRRGGPELALLMGWFLCLGLVALGVGFGCVEYLLPAFGLAAGKRFGFSSRLGAKEEALNLALLRQCCKQLAPGIIMSTEFEMARHFTFAMVDGRSVAIDVLDHQEGDKAAFRKGATLCVQFTHESRACIGMMVVQAARTNRKHLRIVLQAPGKLANIALPKSFSVPVREALQLRVQLAYERDGKEVRWLSNVAEIGAQGLSVVPDGETPKVAEGQSLDASLRLPDQRADVQVKVTGVDGGRVALEILPQDGGLDPSEDYHAVVRTAEVDWVRSKVAA